MSIDPLLSIQRGIKAGLSDDVLRRWKWGRRIVTDDEMVTENGNLKHGKLEWLMAKHERAGMPIKDREIQWRMQVAKAYPTLAQIRGLTTDFPTWDEITHSGFPYIERRPGDEDFDPRTDKEIVDEAEEEARRFHDQCQYKSSLFPLDDFPLDCLLGKMKKYCEKMEAMTSSFRKRDKKRRRYIERLIAAVDGEESRTRQEALVALKSACA